MIKFNTTRYSVGIFLRPHIAYRPEMTLRYVPPVKNGFEAVRTQPVGMQCVGNFFRNLWNKLFKKQPEEVCNDNFVTFKHSKFMGLNESGYDIFHGSKKVGYVHYDIVSDRDGVGANYPSNWFWDNPGPSFYEMGLLKPFMRINEFSMNDRLGKKQLIPRDKKFGTMAMKELLKIANDSGCDDRISLYAGRLGGTKFEPGMFYHKMGFSLSPSRVKELTFMEKRYYLRLKNLLDEGLSETEAKAVLEKQKIFCPVKIDGRYAEDSGQMYLTNPECIRNYRV